MANILFITTGFPPYEFSENIINGKLVIALINEGHSVKVLTKAEEGITYSSVWKEPWLKLEPVTIEINSPRRGMLKRFLEIVGNVFYLKYPIEGIRWAMYAFKKAEEILMIETFDAILTRSPSESPHLVGLRLRKKYNIKWIANWNDPSFGTWPYPYFEKASFLKKMIYRSFAREVMFRADHISFPSERLSCHFREYFRIDDKKIKVIPHIMPDQAEVQDDKYDNDMLYLCHSGNLSPERSPENLFLAIRDFNSGSSRKVFLDIVGVISGPVKEMIRSLKIEEYIRLYPPVPYSEVMIQLAKYDVLVIIEAQMDKSIFLPSKLTDYVQLNKPVLAVSPPESELADLFIRYGGGVAADVHSSSDVKDKLEYLADLKNNDKLKSLLTESRLHNYLGSDRITEMYDLLISGKN